MVNYCALKLERFDLAPDKVYDKGAKNLNLET